MYNAKTIDDDLYKSLIKRVRMQLGMFDDADDEQVAEVIDDVLQIHCQQHYLAVTQRVGLKTRIFNALRRLDILQPLVDDQLITEIMINGTEEIFIENRFHFLLATCVGFENIIEIEELDILQATDMLKKVTDTFVK